MGLGHINPVAKPTCAHHIAALLVIGIGVEQVVGHVFQHDMQEFTGHLGPVGFGVGHGGDVKDVLARDVLSRQDRRPPPHTRAQRDIGLALGQQCVANQVIPRAVEVATPVQQRVLCGGADHLGQLVKVRRTLFVDQCGHRGIRCNHIREDRDQLVPEPHHTAVLHIQIDAANEFAVRP